MHVIGKFVAISILMLATSITLLSSLFIYIDKPGSLEQEKILIFPKNKSLKHISNLLYSSNIIDHPKTFTLIAKFISLKYPFKAGEYKFTPNISIKSVINIMIKGKSIIHKLTFIEGLTTNQILELIKNEDILFGEITSNVGEGELLPDTYFFSYGDTKQLIVDRMQNKMQKYITEVWEHREQNLPINNVIEALTLASIVEKETSNNLERPRVAAVFINRLKKNMKLQADPTTIYAITLGKFNFRRALTREDLSMESKFNTYFTTGLPPHPICNPGRASINAVLHPIHSDELYFVVDGLGGHNFSNNYNQHQKNVKDYRKKLVNK